MKYILSIQVSKEFDYDEDSMGDILVEEYFPELKNLVDNAWTIDNIEMFQL